MEDAFFSQLDGNAVRELLLRTELRHAALFAVSDTLRIERCSDAAQQLSGLHPMEELDPFLSGSTRNILLRCINTQSACTAEKAARSAAGRAVNPSASAAGTAAYTAAAARLPMQDPPPARPRPSKHPDNASFCPE